MSDSKATESVGNNRAELSAWIKQQARAVGFDLVGIAPAVIGLAAGRLADWLAAGKHGEMRYMADQQEARRDPNLVLCGVRSVIMVALAYRTSEPKPSRSGYARISRYAWNLDYHDVLRERLQTLRSRLAERMPGARYRPVVDSAPVMERDFAQLAGLGWIGKNTLLLNRDLGSWFFLGGLLVDQTLEYDAPHQTDHCGTCTRCLDACPTAAFDGPYQLDPRRCISYLTIEHKSPIAQEQRDEVGDWLFGCDVCQDVCPWNHGAPHSPVEGFAPQPGNDPVELKGLLRLSEQEFRDRFRGTPLFRSRRNRVLRNAALVAGSQRCAEAAEELSALLDDPDPLLREAAGWALGKIRRRNDETPKSE